MRIHTRANSSPNGKQRVLFAAHPADALLYEDRYAEMILKHRNCVVWSPESGNEATEPLPTLVPQAQLLLIPVTARFLTEPCPARLALEAAMRWNVPVLLIQEAALNSVADWDRFNAVCHRLQSLNPHDTSADRLPFEQKLAAFLQTALLDDTLSEEIRRDAFDGRLFLSYRKADLNHARRLMRAIHSLPGCEALSLWYDEYLAVGRDFEASITRNLRQSRLMLLTVTPRILEPGNYVRREYGMAREAGVDVLPIELAPADRDAVTQMYPGVGDILTLDDGETIRQKLEALRRRPETVPGAQLHLLGLAYIKGILVEKDVPRGLALLERALAEHAYRPAGRVLMTMYRTGTDVPRDLQRAQAFSEAIAGSYGPITPALLASPLYLELLRDTCDNAELLIEAGKEDLAIRRLASVADWARQRDWASDADARALLLGSLRLLCAACELIGKYEESERYQQELQAIEARVGGAGTVELQLAECRRMLRTAAHSLFLPALEQGKRRCLAAQRKLNDLFNAFGDTMTPDQYRDGRLVFFDTAVTAMELDFYRYGRLAEALFCDALAELERLLDEYRESAGVCELARRLYRIRAKADEAGGDFAAFREHARLAEEYARRSFTLRQCTDAELLWLDARLDALYSMLMSDDSPTLEQMQLLARLRGICEQFHLSLFNRPEAKSALAKYHFLAEALFVNQDMYEGAVKNAREAIRYADTAGRLRNHPDDALTLVNAASVLRHFPHGPDLEEAICEALRDLRKRFPENAFYFRMLQLAERELPARSRQEDPQALLRQCAVLYRQLTRQPVGPDRLRGLDALCQSLRALGEDHPDQPGFGQLRAQAVGTINQDIRALKLRAHDLGYTQVLDPAEMQRNVDAALAIFDALLELFPNDSDLMQDRRMVVLLQKNRTSH